MRIDVWADVTCPWCFLGKRRLDRALNALTANGGPAVDVFWRPYQLNPTAPAHGEPLDPQALSRHGANHSGEHIEGYIGEVVAGAREGFRWQPKWRVNTFDAHRLLAVARHQGGTRLQSAVKESLLQTHFSGGNLGDHRIIAAAAEQAGMTGPADILASDEAAEEVRADLVYGLSIGITSVPTFVVGSRAVGGAQSPDVILDLLRSEPTESSGSRTVYSGGSELENFRRAEALVDGGDPLNALRLLEPLLAEHGTTSSVRLLAARAYFGSAQLNRARQQLDALVEADPTDDYVRFMLGRVAERQNRMEEARSHFLVAAALHPSEDYQAAVRRSSARVASIRSGDMHS